MNDDDLRDCFAMFAMLGLLINGKYPEPEAMQYSYTLADIMLEARKPKEEAGIAAIKPRTRRSK